jgi:VIT1/CCC1 family predicted Fe2+/Mn2+ transporter
LSAWSIVRMAKAALADETLANTTYSRLAQLYSSDAMRGKLAEISEMEMGHARFWAEFLERRGYEVSSIRAGRLRVFLYILLLRTLGLSLTLRMLERSESSAVEHYSKMLDSPEVDDSVKGELKRILEDEFIHEQEFAEEESMFKEFTRHVRDAVLGMNDGLVEILSVTAGLAGAYGNPLLVALSGVIVSIAGALSMGIGTFASVRAQRQVHEGIIGRILVASRYVAHLLKDRIGGYMAKKGYSANVSQAIAEESSEDSRMLSWVIAEERHGLREEDLGSPGKAAVYSGLFNMVGALVPLIPYFLRPPISTAIALSLLFVGLALAFTGFLVALLADLPLKRKMLEMVLVGFGSAGASYAVGTIASMLFGVSVG